MIATRTTARTPTKPKKIKISKKAQAAASLAFAKAAAKLASVVKRTDWLYPIPYFCTAIIRGKWEPYAIEVCASLGVTVDTSRRKIRSAWDRASEHPLSGAVRRRVRRALSILGLSRQ